MIYGIGTDLVEVSRILKSISNGDRFKKLVFSSSEIDYCESQRNPAENFAARFAAKEAFLKALGTGWAGQIKFVEIEIRNDDAGKPFFVLHGEAQAVFIQRKLKKVHVSLSHIKEVSMATVVIEA
ncbi:MAG TPA: holo-ACP synthase [Cytophagaceae bacterium]|jgi:holo-[acyl-carrier protein] synthase